MKSFIIHLSKIESSLSTALNLKRQLEDFNMPVELFEGTYGNDAVRLMEDEKRTVHPCGIKGEITTDIKNFHKMISPGVRGCFYSHYRLWTKCVELNEPIIIFEDDIILTRSFIAINWKDILIVALGHPTKSIRYMPFLESPSGDPSAEYYKQSSMPGCCGYAIKPQAAKKLIDTYKNTFLPADNAINKSIVEIEIHNYIMGIALTKKDGKKSLTKSKGWGKTI
jgi:GR25 family glycosyltransferase involved in LPS biosynthesis